MSGRSQLRSRPARSDDQAIACARIMRAFDGILAAAMADLRLRYAVRFAAILAVRTGNPAAALEALTLERDAAMTQLASAILEERDKAMKRVTGRRVTPHAVPTDPTRPGRTNRLLVRPLPGTHHPNP